MGSVYLPAQGVLSLSAPPGDLALFASGWRLSLEDGVQHALSFHLRNGNTLRATVDAGAAPTELWGNRDALWFSGATGLTLLPPLQPISDINGIPLPID